MILNWFALDPRVTPEHLGFIPSFLDDADERPLAEQIDAHYAHGGGWRSHPHLERWSFDEETLALRYAGDDDPYQPIAACTLRGEVLLLYPSSWVLILQPDGKFDISRID